MRTTIVLLAVTVAAGAYLLSSTGVYGITLFAILPLLGGMLGAAFRNSRTFSHAAKCGILACILASSLYLLLGLEGFICILMSLPSSVLFGAVGGILYVWIVDTRRARASLMLIPLTLGLDTTAQPQTYEVTTTIEINASPARVWQNVAQFSSLSEPKEWYFHTGIAYPTGTRITGQGLGATRYCDLSTGPVVETITAWEPSRLLEFDVTETPAPMIEWGIYGDVTPKHLHGYFVSKHGRFKLIPLANNRTRLEGTSWYQHGLYPGGYWRIWSDVAIHKIHQRVFDHIQKLSEH